MNHEKDKTVSSSSSPSFTLTKGINGLDKILLRESRGASAEVIVTVTVSVTVISNFFFFFRFCIFFSLIYAIYI
jgi:hypothetical protein